MSTNRYAPPRAFVQDIADPHAAGEVADRGTRLGAALLDGIIFGAMVYAPIMLAAIVGGAAGAAAAGRSDGSNAASVVVIAGAVLTLVGLIVWCWLTIKYIKENGQSIAKKLLGIKVVRTDGSPISLGRLFWLRNIVNGVVSIIPLYGFVDMLFIFGESRRCLHDKIADTIVVKA